MEEKIEGVKAAESILKLTQDYIEIKKLIKKAKSLVGTRELVETSKKLANEIKSLVEGL